MQQHPALLTFSERITDTTSAPSNIRRMALAQLPATLRSLGMKPLSRGTRDTHVAHVDLNDVGHMLTELCLLMSGGCLNVSTPPEAPAFGDARALTAFMLRNGLVEPPVQRSVVVPKVEVVEYVRPAPAIVNVPTPAAAPVAPVIVDEPEAAQAEEEGGTNTVEGTSYEQPSEESALELPPLPKAVTKMTRQELLDWLSHKYDVQSLEKYTRQDLMTLAKSGKDQ